MRPPSEATLALREVGGTYTVDRSDLAAVAQADKTASRLRSKGFAIVTVSDPESGEKRFENTGFAEPEPKAKAPAKAKRVAKVRHPALSTLLRVTTIGEAPDDGIVLALTDDSGKTWVARLEVV